MATDAWLPRQFAIGDGITLRSVVASSLDWQIYSTSRNGVQALVAKQKLAARWQEPPLLPDGALRDLSFGQHTFALLVSGREHAMCSLAEARSPQSATEAFAFAASLRNTRRLLPDTPIHDALYIEKYSLLLPTYSMSPSLTDDVVLGSFLSGGVHVSCRSMRRLAAMLTWLPHDELIKVIETAGLGGGAGEASAQSLTVDDIVGELSLPGRPLLQEFFREHVIDIVQNRERYRALGIDHPSAIVLHGPPGCGKTFAVERLVEYLGWPIYQIASGTVGSPYIHETGRKVAEIFATALDQSPSIVVIDEMEAWLSDREQSTSSGGHHVEEVAEFLRRIPEAVKGGVLIIGMTNRLEMIDPAILRRGRFDHVIEVGMPTEQEVGALLNNLLAKVPVAGDVQASAIAPQLAGRPLADVAFVVREAGRRAARAGRDTVDQASLLHAVATAPVRDPSTEVRPRIGFV